MSDIITVPIWWKPGGGMAYRRDALPHDHPEHTYNYMKDQLGVTPEDYGVYHPLAPCCPHCGKQIKEWLEEREEFETFKRHCG